METIALQIVTDSTCELTKEDQDRLGVIVVPLTVHFTDASYRDGIDLTREEFYNKLEQAETMPTTSMVPPEQFEEVFSACVDRGDDVVGIFISSDISGTYHAACIASESFPVGRVSVIDSRSASMSLALLVLEAVKLRDAGSSAAELVEQMKPLIKNVRFFAAVNTLKYLRKGGRISATSAVVGEVLGIKPIVTIVDGTIHSIGKARGMTSAIKHLLQEAMRQMPDLCHEFVFAHTGAPELLEKAISQIKGPLGLKSYFTCELGATIGTYAGRGCVGVAYIAE
ncbi:MAG: degV family protein [Firmicutes bacterium]|nr:degV family protein [Bacillota bacterium]